MTCLACRESEHDCCDNLLFPGTCVCGCAHVMDPPMLRSSVLIILGGYPHDRVECGREYYNEVRRRKRRERAEVA